MKSIFRELNSAIASTDNPKKLSVLRKINDYILSGVWEKKKGGSKPVVDTLGMSPEEACEYLGMSIQAYRVMIKRASDQIRGIIGSEIIQDIKYGDDSKVQDALIQFRIRSTGSGLENFVPSCISEAVSGVNKSEYSILELDKEISVLSELTNGFLKNRLDGCDTDKLRFIFNVISDSDSSHLEKRAELFKRIVRSTERNSEYYDKK